MQVRTTERSLGDARRSPLGSPSSWLWGNLHLLSWRFQKGSGQLTGNNNNNNISKYVLPARHCAKYLTFINSFNHNNNPRSRYYCHPHVMDEETKAQRYRNFTRSSSKRGKQTHAAHSMSCTLAWVSVASRKYQYPVYGALLQAETSITINPHCLQHGWQSTRPTHVPSAFVSCPVTFSLTPGSARTPPPPPYTLSLCLCTPALSFGVQYGAPPSDQATLPFSGYFRHSLTSDSQLERLCTPKEIQGKSPGNFFSLMTQTPEKLHIAIQSLIEHFQYMKSVPSRVLFHLFLIAPQWHGYWGLWFQ